MVDMLLAKTELPTLLPEPRNKNLFEAPLGYTEEQAVAEAKRCLNCKSRNCISGCPVQVNIPEFIEEIAAGNFEKAYAIIAQSCILPAVCGRVCPLEAQCEGKCVRGINGESVGIGRLERFAADYWG